MTRPVFYPTRRGGRVVECGGLENRHEGSNPSSSASLNFELPAMEAFLLSGPPRTKAGGGVRTRRGAELGKRVSVCAAASPARSAGDVPPPSVCLCSRCVKGLRRGDRLQTTYRQGFPRRSWRRAGRWRTFLWPGRLPCRRALGFRLLPQTCGA